jgi:hypothetical protein
MESMAIRPSLESVDVILVTHLCVLALLDRRKAHTGLAVRGGVPLRCEFGITRSGINASTISGQEISPLHHQATRCQ